MSRKPSPWISHVKNYASENSITYKQAMQHPECKSSYKNGGSILGKMKDTFKKAGKTINKAGKDSIDYIKHDAGNDIKDTYGEVNQYALKNDFGGKIQMIKNAIPPAVTQMVLQDALMAAGVPSVAAGSMAGSATGAVYSVDFSRSLKGQGQAALKGAMKGAVNGGQSAIKQNSKNKTGEGFNNNTIDENKMKRTIARIQKQGGSFNGSGMSFCGGSFKGSGIHKYEC